MKRRLEEIDFLRGMAILMVILYHSILVYPVNLHEIPWCSALHEFLWLVEMPLFFLVSGFCFSFKESYSAYLWKKIKRILVPHIVFASVDLIPRMIPNNLVNEKMNWKDGLHNLVLYGGNDWFLWTLFLIMMVFPLLHRFMQMGILPKILVAVLVVGCYVMQGEITGLFLLSTVAKFFLYFFLGYILQNLPYEKIKKVGSNPAFAILFAGVSGVVFFAGGQNGYVVEFTVALASAVVCYFVALCIVGSSASSQGSSKASSKGSSKRNVLGRVLGVCSKYSLQMYLLDGYALVVTRTILVTVMGMTSPVLLIVANFILDSLIVLVISKYILDRFKLFRFVSGLS